MELNINSPSYYKTHYGIDDDIYWLCRNISECLKDKIYSDIVDIIGICPIVAPDELIKQGLWKERTEYHLADRLIIVSRHIEFLPYIKGSLSDKKKLMVRNILQSVRSVSKKGKIDYPRFETDILEHIGFDISEGSS